MNDLLSFDGWDEGDVGQIQLYDVVFSRDFGVFKKDEKVKTLTVDHNAGTMQSFDDEGNMLKTQDFALTPK